MDSKTQLADIVGAALVPAGACSTAGHEGDAGAWADAAQAPSRAAAD
jgi:hypothetical protein